MRFYQTVELENDCEVKVQCDIHTSRDIDMVSVPWEEMTNFDFSESFVQLFGVEVEIKSLPSALVKAIKDYAQESACDMGWEQ